MSCLSKTVEWCITPKALMVLYFLYVTLQSLSLSLYLTIESRILSIDFGLNFECTSYGGKSSHFFSFIDELPFIACFSHSQ